ncbi:hypothetical protein KKF91_12950, partial [Myxococcota bacterium]|nr:hypothetical protein [Myxococcota bacterium]
MRYRLMLLLALGLWACDDSASSSQPQGGADASPDGGGACQIDEDCADDAYCDEGGACQAGCRAGGCPEGESCDPQSRACVEIQTRQDTGVVEPDTGLVEPDTGLVEPDGAVEGCLEDTTCPAEAYCGPEGACLEGCRAGGCAAGEACDLASRACVPEAEAAAACCIPEGCIMLTEAACVADGGAPMPGEDCSLSPDLCEVVPACVADEDCPQDQYCDANKCADGCRVGADCGEAAFCDEAIHQCVPETCAQDEACPDGTYCDDEGACVIGCRWVPDTCPPPAICTPDHVCEAQGCDNDQDCPEDTYCDPSGECRARCEEHAACEEGERCTPDGRCAPGCRDDLGVEPDDTQADALALSFSGASAAATAHLCPDSLDDWYSLELSAAGMPVRVNLTFLHVNGDIDVELVDEAGEVITRSESSTDNEAIDYPQPGEPPLSAGRYYIHVYALGLNAGAAYDLDARISSATASCEADAAEPDNTEATATVILEGEAAALDVRARTLCSGDEDWLRFTLRPNDGLSVALRILGNGGEGFDALDMALYGPGAPGSPSAVVRQINETGADGRLYIIIPPNSPGLGGGDYFLIVRGADDRQFSDYELRFELDRALDACAPDPLEDNDDAASATDAHALAGFSGIDGQLQPNQDLIANGLTACAGDEDWFSVELADGDTLQAAVNRQSPQGPLALRIENSLGQILSQSEGQGSSVVARIREISAGTYYIVASSVENSQDSYDLLLYRVPSFTGDCMPDEFDEIASNNTRRVASQIEPGSFPALTMCVDDEDWYTFTTDARGDIVVNLDFSIDHGDLDLYVYDSDLNEIGYDDNVQSGATIDLGVQNAGQYYVQVELFDNGPVPYGMDVLFTPEGPLCTDDPFEEGGNDDVLSADALEPGVNDGRWICDGDPLDQDWFTLLIPQGVSGALYLRFDHNDDGDLGLMLNDEMGVVIGGCQNVGANGFCVSDSRTASDECFDIEAGAAQTLFIRVYANA